eukprot:1417813-Rhodomonas_salina.1
MIAVLFRITIHIQYQKSGGTLLSYLTRMRQRAMVQWSDYMYPGTVGIFMATRILNTLPLAALVLGYLAVVPEDVVDCAGFITDTTESKSKNLEKSAPSEWWKIGSPPPRIPPQREEGMLRRLTSPYKATAKREAKERGEVNGHQDEVAPPLSYYTIAMIGPAWPIRVQSSIMDIWPLTNAMPSPGGGHPQHFLRSVPADQIQLLTLWGTSTQKSLELSPQRKWADEDAARQGGELRELLACKQQLTINTALIKQARYKEAIEQGS